MSQRPLSHPIRWWGVGVVAALTLTLAVSGVALAAPRLATPATQAQAPAYLWPRAHGDPANDGTTLDPAISTSNAATLGVNWMTYLGGAALSSPIVAWNQTRAETLVFVVNSAGRLVAFNASNGLPVWSRKIGPADSTPLADGSSYIWLALHNGGRIYKLNAATGATVCSAPVAQSSGQSISASPVLATPPGGSPTVYIGAVSGPITAVNEANCAVDFQVESEPDKTSPSGMWDFLSYAVSATGEGLVLYGTADPDSSVYANDAITGQLVWRYQVVQPPGDYDIGAGPTISAPGNNGIADGVVYVESKYGVLNAIDLTTGALIWSQQLPSPAISTPALSGTDLVVGTEGNGVLDFNAVTGAVNWQFSDSAGLDASVAIIGPVGAQVVAFGDFAGAFDVLSLASGSLLYQDQTGGYFIASPAEAAGNIFTVSGNEFLYDFAPGGSNVGSLSTSVASPTDSSTVVNPNGSITVSGSASAPSGADSVTVDVQSAAGSWWDASTRKWTAGAYPNQATLVDPGGTTSNWTFAFPVTAGGGSFTVFASTVSQAVADVSAGLSPPTSARSTFEVEPSTTEPILTTSQSWAAPGSQVVLNSSGYSPGEDVQITLDGHKVSTVAADGSGNLDDASVTIPSTVNFGPGSLTATGLSSGLVGSVRIYVTNTWSQFGESATLTGDDPNDNVFKNHVRVSANSYLTQAWSFTAEAPVAGSVDVSDGTAYFVDQAGNVYAVSMRTGMQEWIQQIAGSPEVTSTPALTTSGLVVVTTSTGEVVALDTATGDPSWTAQLNGALSSPSVTAGVVYVGSSNGTVSALNATSGTTIWSSSVTGAVASAPAVDTANGIVAVGDSSGAITALNASTGSVIWSVTTGGPVTTSPMIVNGTVYAGSSDGSLHAIVEATGASVWAFTAGAAITTTPAFIFGQVAFGTSGGVQYWVRVNGSLDRKFIEPAPVVGVAGAGNFSAVTTSDGSIVGTKSSESEAEGWLTTQGSTLTGAPTVVNGEVIVASQNGTVDTYTVPGQPAF